jgi:hypothetical protein
MKYLRRFNEDSNDIIEEVKSFCEMYLVDLLDNGGDVRIDKIPNRTTFIVTLFLGDGENMPIWGDVKDYFIPFLRMFNREYLLGSSITLYNNKSIELLSELLLGDVGTSNRGESEYITDKDSIRAITFKFTYDKVNESFPSNQYPRRELESFCKDHLINMIDTFGTKIVVLNRISYYEIRIDTNTYPNRIAWDDIKDDFIPFFQLLCMDYDLIATPLTRKCVKMGILNFTKNAILNDSIGKSPVGSIIINVKKAPDMIKKPYK